MRLEKWLTKAGITRAEMARRIKVEPPTITRIIAGTQNIPLSLQDAINRETAGEVTPVDLLKAFVAAKKASAA